VKIAVLALLAVIAAGLLWGAGEMHYDNCVNAAKARAEAVDRTDAGSILESVSGDALREGVEGCSRLPF
jgi:hypothetical protein